MYKQHNIVARSCNHCCKGKATKHYVCIVELHATANRIKTSSVTQKCFYGKVMSLATIKRANVFM